MTLGHNPPQQRSGPPARPEDTPFNQARPTRPGGVSELEAALHLLHLPDETLEVGKVTIFVEDACEAPARPCPTNPVEDTMRLNPGYTVMCDAFPKEPAWYPALPPAIHMPRSSAHPLLSLHHSRTKGTVWQEHPGTPLLVLSVKAGGDPEQVLAATQGHLYGQ